MPHEPSPSTLKFDFLVIGSGAAGLMLASKLAVHGSVAVVCKSDYTESNTYRAQGGIAIVQDESDSFETHIRDTLEAGGGLCHPEVVREVVTHGADALHELLAIGTPFDREGDHLHLTQEGGHSQRRIAHVQDSTGRAIAESLRQAAASHPTITFLSRHLAVDLITSHRLGRFGESRNRVLGAYLLTPAGEVVTVAASQTILASGGAGKVYQYTTNPHSATGDGIAMAWRAGCSVMNMEFMQFHPTALFHPGGSTFLLTEALRGEGAHLIDKSGRRFVFDYDARGELAPRDIVARAIDHEMKRQGCDCIYLDARHLGASTIATHFPNIAATLLELGLDLASEPIPVVPAAHYMCGGVQTALDGATELAGLYVIGEAACTGLHGANRLASNSLLECLVMADLCAAAMLAAPPSPPSPPLPLWDASGVVPEEERVQIKQNWDEIRATMSNYVGIVRSDERLRRARRRLNLIQEEIAAYYWQHPISRDLIELRNLSLVADLIVRSALSRQESRGLHFSTDHPQTDAVARDTILRPE